MTLALEHADGTLFDHACRITQLVYNRADDSLRPTIAEIIDTTLHWIMTQFHVRHPALAARFSEEKALREYPLLVRALRWVLWLIKLAVESNRMQDAEDFHDRLLEHDHGVHDYDGITSAIGRRSLELHYYVNLVLIAWVVHSVHRHQLPAKNMKALVRHALDKCGTRQEIIRLWEAMSTPVSGLSTDLNRDLSLNQFDRPIGRFRSGQTITGWGRGDEWIERGFIAVALAASGAPHRRVKGVPPVEYDLERFKNIAEEAVSSPPLRDLLGLDEPTATTQVDALMEVFRGRECIRRMDLLTRTVTAPLDSTKCAQLADTISSALPSRRRLAKLIDAAARTPVASNTPATNVTVTCHMPHHYFVDKAPSVEWEEHLASELGKQENLVLAGEIKNHALSVAAPIEWTQLT